MSDLAWDLEDETDGVDLDVGGGVKVGVLGGQLEEDDDDLRVVMAVVVEEAPPRNARR